MLPISDNTHPGNVHDIYDIYSVQELPYMHDNTPNIAHPLVLSPPWFCLYSAKMNETSYGFNSKWS